MKRQLFLLSLLGFAPAAFGAPMALDHQGRLLDATGVPLVGNHDLGFFIYDKAQNGHLLWSETLEAEFDNGYYSVTLGLDETSNPLDDAIFDEGELYLTLSVNSGPELGERQLIVSVPFAIRARQATDVVGGIVDVSEIRINGNTVIDDTGAFVVGTTLMDLPCYADEIPLYNGVDWECASAAVSWDDLLDMPAGFADGVDDTLTETQVEKFITDEPIDLADGSTMDGEVISTGSHTIELDWAHINNVPAGLDDGDDNTQLLEAEVETYITNDAINLAPNTTVGGLPIATGDITQLPWSSLINVPPGFGDGIDNVDDGDTDDSNEIQVLSQLGDSVSLSNGGGTVNIDADSTNELQTIDITGDMVTLSNSGGSFSITDADSDATNELQTVSVTGDVATLSLGGGTFSLQDADADPSNELQTLSKTGNVVTISGVGSTGSDSVTVDDADADATNEFQTISLTGLDLTLSDGGGTVTLTDNVDDADADATNEIQTISKAGTTVTLSDGGGSFTDAVDDADASASNELQNLSLVGTSLTISNGNTIDIADGDGDSTNEYQTISLTGLDLTLSDGGGTVTLTDNVNDA
ncbi:MAG: hypothetical protein HN348_15125, partial [Proteobacteria bacterium]|nr:hypothetical protein [Pseudomonadota bacterium]